MSKMRLIVTCLSAFSFLIVGVYSQDDSCFCPIPNPGNSIASCFCNGFVQANWVVEEPRPDDMIAIYRCSDEEKDFVVQPLTFLWACGDGNCTINSGTSIFDSDPGLTSSPDFEWPPPACECLFVTYQRGDVADQSPPPYEFVVRGGNFMIYDEAECPEPSEAPSPFPTPEPTPDPTPGPTPDPTPEPTPDPTPGPTPDPTPEPTPGPTSAPTPEPTPGPTPDPTPEPTPAPTLPPTPMPVLPLMTLSPSTPPSPSPTLLPPPLCEDLGNCYYVCGEAPCKRPSQIIFEYTGKFCTNPLNNNTQEGKFVCDDFGNIETSVTPKTIGFSDKDRIIGEASEVGVGDCVSVGHHTGKVDCVTLQPITATRQLRGPHSSVGQPSGGRVRARLLKSGSQDGGGGGGGNCLFRFEADTTIMIKAGTSTLQEMSIHTSCSKGLFVGDVYASLTIKYLLFDLA